MLFIRIKTFLKLANSLVNFSLDSLSLLVRLKCISNEILFVFCNNFFAQYIVELWQYLPYFNKNIVFLLQLNKYINCI